MALIVSNQSGITESLNSIGSVNELIIENSSNSVDHAVKETVIVIRSAPISKEELDHENHSCVIDVKSGNGIGEEEIERVCRICQLSSQVLFERSSGNYIKEIDLIQIGCGCKAEMGIAHSHCAETWFKLKGNRVCEICGEAAKNITGIRDQFLVDEWNEVRLNSIPGSEGSEGCWRGKPLCNFLMACLVLAFVVPWFFRLTWFK